VSAVKAEGNVFALMILAWLVCECGAKTQLPTLASGGGEAPPALSDRMVTDWGVTLSGTT
jgi:hypothetical protein